MCDVQIEGDCFNANRRECYPLNQRCDNHDDCDNGIDERFCCEEGQLGCYVYSALRTVNNTVGTVYRCLDQNMMCNGVMECIDGSDERECENVYFVLLK